MLTRTFCSITTQKGRERGQTYTTVSFSALCHTCVHVILCFVAHPSKNPSKKPAHTSWAFVYHIKLLTPKTGKQGRMGGKFIVSPRLPWIQEQQHRRPTDGVIIMNATRQTLRLGWCNVQCNGFYFICVFVTE